MRFNRFDSDTGHRRHFGNGGFDMKKKEKWFCDQDVFKRFDDEEKRKQFKKQEEIKKLNLTENETSLLECFYLSSRQLNKKHIWRLLKMELPETKVSYSTCCRYLKILEDDEFYAFSQDEARDSKLLSKIISDTLKDSPNKSLVEVKNCCVSYNGKTYKKYDLIRFEGLKVWVGCLNSDDYIVICKNSNYEFIGKAKAL